MFRESNQAFANRRQAGAELAAKLEHYAGRDDVVVLALPRGGVPVAFEVAEELDAELDIFLVRKLGMHQPARVIVAETTDDEVRPLLRQHADRLRTGGHPS